MKKAIGSCLVALPFIYSMIDLAITAGWAEVLSLIGTSVVTIACILIGLYLISE